MTDEPIDGPIDGPTTEADDAATPAKEQPARRTRWGPRPRVAVASLALTAILFLFVFPTRSYLAQQRQVGRARDAVAVLRSQNKELAREAKRLETPGEIERLARQQFNMVMPGEQAYNVVPAPAASTATTTTTVP
jgi:cell division protein FtsB